MIYFLALGRKQHSESKIIRLEQMGLQIITFLHQSHLFKKKHLQTNEK